MPASPRALREQRPGERVGLDVHHHHVLAVLAASERVRDSRRGAAGRIDHDLGRRVRDGALGVVGDKCSPVALRLVEGARRAGRRGQPTRGERGARAVRREVRHRENLQSGRAPRLREVHRAELARADQRDAHGPLFGRAALQQAVEVHTVGTCRRTA